MGFKCGIVGLPNVGKSTLFNALTQTAAAQAANYPFCTIEPNVGDVAVPDPRLATLSKIAASKEIIPTRLSFVDIAGLVRGASKGEGLGNQFLANIRECDAIAHVVRCFDDGDVTHVEGRVDPLSMQHQARILRRQPAHHRSSDPRSGSGDDGNAHQLPFLNVVAWANYRWRKCECQQIATMQARLNPNLAAGQGVNP